MSRKRSLAFQGAVIAFIVAIVFLAAIFNAYSFINSSVEAVGDNKAAMLSSVKGSLEYGLKYGRELENYYGIEEVTDKAVKYCDAENVFITDKDLVLLYGSGVPEDLQEKIQAMEWEEHEEMLWIKDDVQYIVLPIIGKEDTAGYIGITCSTGRMKVFSYPYVKKITLFALVWALLGIAIFELLFFLMPHNFRETRLRFIIMLTVIVVNVGSVIPTFFVLRSGYEALSRDVGSTLIDKNADDIKGLLDQGVLFSDIKDVDQYYDDLSSSSRQIASITLTEAADGDIKAGPLTDEEGNSYYLNAMLDRSFIASRVRKSVINTIVTTITAIMIAMEILIFLLGLLVGKKRERKGVRDNSEHKTIEELGVVRGLSFFYSSFRYMSVAFMSIVLADIYKPVFFFGREIPYEILMSFPLSGQVFISMITSYLSGRLIQKTGWKRSTVFGMIVMMAGTLASSFATDPVTFILAQMVMGTGLGFAKMGIDIYAVAVSSGEDMSSYTSGGNAGVIVGYSCSAAIGALVASIFGYSGAYLVMTVLGLFVLLLILSFGMDVRGISEEEETVKEESKEDTPAGIDLRFPTYIILIIIPYYFVMMFGEYFFPVYANSNGISTDTIGYVMLIYGVVTAYIGTPLCPRLTKRFKVTLLMPMILLILAGSLFAFAIHNLVIVAALIVTMIGVVDGIMPSIQFMYVYDLPLAKKLGFSRALGIEGFFSSLIGAVAPVIFGIVMLYGNGGLILVAALITVCAVIFILLNRAPSKKSGGKAVSMILVFVLTVLSIILPLTRSGMADTNASGDRGKLRIGYSQEGGYYEFDYQIYQIGMGLLEKGEIESPELAALSQGDTSDVVWKALCEGKSDHFEFVPEGYIDLLSTDYAFLSEEEMQKKVGDVIRDEDIDLMITMGTSAGLMIRDASDVPYMNFLASDPVSSEIVEGAKYSGSDRAWAHVSTGLEEKALSVMYDIFSPRSIGITYNGEDPEAYIYSGAKSVDAFADQKRMKVIRDFVTDEYEDTPEAYEEYKKILLDAHKRMAETDIDVFIMTTSGLELDDFYDVLYPFMEKGIPVFSINSTEDVRAGALGAVEMFDYQNIGRLAADTMMTYRSGEELSQLSQEYVTPPFLVLNVDTMRKTGIRLPLDTMLSASNIYGRYKEAE